MYDRGYFSGYSSDWKNDRKQSAGLLQAFFARDTGAPLAAGHCRQGGSAKSKINPNAIEAWRQRVLIRAMEEFSKLPEYDALSLDENFLRWLVGLSCLPQGPLLACNALQEKGIALVIEPQLDHSHLDGAAMLGPGGRPVIGLTLRHNRLDNFCSKTSASCGRSMLPKPSLRESNSLTSTQPLGHCKRLVRP